jgi:regulator of replication initiation timing
MSDEKNQDVDEPQGNSEGAAERVAQEESDLSELGGSSTDDDTDASFPRAEEDTTPSTHARASTVPEFDRADFELLIRGELAPVVKQIESQTMRQQMIAQRVGYGAIMVIILTGILLFVAAGRLAGEVGNLESATLAISKRIVNMNSALESFARFEQGLGMLDEGQASILRQLDATAENLRLSQEDFSGQLLTATTSLANQTQDTTELDALLNQVSELKEQVASTQRDIDQFKPTINSLNALRSDVAALVDIEKSNLRQLLARQIELETAKLAEEEASEPTGPSYSPEIIVFTPEQESTTRVQ